jgi:hypothetical protein
MGRLARLGVHPAWVAVMSLSIVEAFDVADAQYQQSSPLFRRLIVISKDFVYTF